MERMPPLDKLSPEVPGEIRSHRYPELDALRGLAASTVIFHHLLLLWNNAGWYLPLLATPARLFFAGPQAVVLFFILSGFVLSAQQASPRRPNYVGYLLKRMSRIYVPYLAALALAVAFDAWLYLRIPTENAWFNKTWSHAPQWREVAMAAITSLHDTPQFNTAFWSVLIEIRISFLFPALYLLVKRLPVWASVVLTGTMLALNPLIPDDPWFQSAQAVVLFLFGSLAFLHLGTLRNWMTQRTSTARLLLLFAGLAAYTYGNATIHYGPVHHAMTVHTAVPGTPAAAVPATPSQVILHGLHAEVKQGRFAMCALASLLLMLGAITEPWLHRFLLRPLFLRLGALSYSIYLLHGTVLFALARGLFGKIPIAAFVLLFTALVYLSAELFHLLVDAPSLKLGRIAGRLPWVQRAANP